MAHFNNLTDFLLPVNVSQIAGDESYRDGQIGKYVSVFDESFPDLEQADVIIVGCNEQRGSGNASADNAADEVRAAFYQLYYWHSDIALADIGNLKKGASLNDSYAALQTVVTELISNGK